LAALEASPATAGRLGLRHATIVGAVLLLGLILRFAAYLVFIEGAEPRNYLEDLCIWSCEWYSSIVEGGYDASPRANGFAIRANWAYFPLFPGSVWLLKTLTGLPVQVAGFVLANLYAAAAAVASRPLFGDDTRAWWLFVVTLLIGPFSFLFSTLYSESLFILLTILALVALRRGDYLAAGVVGALLSATRPTGCLIVFAILAQVFLDHQRDGGTIRTFPARVLRDVNVMLAFLVAPLGLFVYMTYLYFHVGDAIAFAHIQIGWGRDLGSPVTTLIEALQRPLRFDFKSLAFFAWACAAIVGILLSLLLIVRGRIAAGVFCALCIIVSLATGVGSMVRFLAGLAPLGILVVELAARWRPSLYLTVLLAVILDIALTVGRFNGSEFVM
jgi:hypothetical protein